MDANKPPGGISGLDRKAMEEERLARQAARKKRERSISPPVRSPRKAPKIEEKGSTVSESGARLEAFSSMVQQDQRNRKPEVANSAVENMKKPATGASSSQTQAKPETLPQGALKYPNGVIKKTWAFGHERTGNDIKLEEVLEPNSVRTAVLSAFQWDDKWVLSKLKTALNGGETKVIFVMQVKDPDEREHLRQEAEKSSSFLRLCLPSMSGLINCMHSKLMLLFHRNKLRIAIPSANLLNFDWGETGQMENSVFIVDLPRLPEGSTQTLEDLTSFGQELMFFIRKQGLDSQVRDGVLNFDFAATKDMAFVHTVGGVHQNDDADRTGLLGLSRAVREMKLNTSEDLEIDFAASSIGTLNEKYLQDLHSAAQGKDLIQQATAARSKAAANFFGPKSAAKKESKIRERMRIYFPTKETVRASTAGAAGTICLQRKYFEAKTFPKDVFRDYKSTRAGMLSHNKIMCARGKQGSDQVAWVYVGSANMSKSAWGELPADRKHKRISCRNWECGVLLPVVRPPASKETVKGQEGHDDSETETEDEEDDETTGAIELPDMSVFKEVIDLPFQTPGEVFNGREPWYFTEKQT